jgi:phosphoribosylaminoimidazole carboxylase PurE protein
MKNTLVIVVMGSESDFPVMKEATILLKKYGIKCDNTVVSAHRTPHLMQKNVAAWEKSGVKIIIAGAGGAAHLPGMLASYSVLPVIGVPVQSKALGGLDSLLSVAQMPKGVPVATVAVNNSFNAALLALEILGIGDSKIQKKIKNHKKKMVLDVKAMNKNISKLSSQLK